MFKPVGSRVNLPEMEKAVLAFWREKKVFEHSVQRRQGSPHFILYEGPPTANGNPGIHHVLTRVFKDVIPRYKTMKGFYAPRRAGWDTHGLPVELEVEKELGFSTKSQIEDYGIEKFNARCRESVFRYRKEWEELTERIGFWIDISNPYMTMDNSFIESGWWAIKQMWDKDLIYQGHKTAAHCPRCGTSLSSHEVALGYRDDTEDPSVYIKFRVVHTAGKESHTDLKLLNLIISRDVSPLYLLAWTTTPWTLPGNTALAVASDADYAVVEVDNEYLIFADALRERVGLGDRRVVMKVKGSDLVGFGYEPLFDPHAFGVQRLKMPTFAIQEKPEADPLTGRGLTYKVIDANFVSMEDGTGIVHIAPAFGELDFDAGDFHGLDFVQPVDLQGKVTGTYPAFAGKFVKEADPLVIENLKSRGLLYKSEIIRHTYPFCWRCGTPLLYYVKKSWYIKTTALKDRLIDGNEEINWYPEHIKHGRFGDWLENNVDWAFSRERYWGTPLPVWYCESCSSYECVGSSEDLKNKTGCSGWKEPLDLHRPFVDGITFNCSKCGAVMHRVPEVIDCWFDSGAMPTGQWHYPFENKESFENTWFPADYISEAMDQTRGWFYSLHAISTLLFGRPCYRNVICLGLILDDKGEKMSKAKGNVVEPFAVINQYGADALRWYCLTSSPPGNVRRFSTNALVEITRRFLLTLWNVYSFFVTYANIDRFTPGEGTDSAPPELDRWIISELNQLVMDVDSALNSYDPTEAGRRIENFVDELSNWYVRRSRRRFWKSESDADKLSAYNTLYHCLVTLSKLLAPLTPFMAEELYQNLVRSAFPDAPESIHLTDFPVADESKIDRNLSADTHLVMKIASLGRAARAQAGIKVRQPLAEVLIRLDAKKETESLKHLQVQILEELNAKSLKTTTGEEELDKQGYASCSEGSLTVAISTEVTPELQAEGMAREVVHRLQTMRRSAGFDIADYILTCFESDDYIKQVMESHAEYIKQETLSRQLIEGVPKEDVYTESHKLSGHTVLLGVRRAN